ncbi:chloramphenicol O-acetyltransferase type A [Pedobacter cryoconitis]|uniref:Chloramphenicol O-acetyltransferase type A n=1 Tax=Pedobacter cryoconitis TaxID=188932 RepID=A0A7W8ZQ18_9SPHI|nr:CatA-like O-acetyltransferase [Pedobacter cryoconitis]MBB5638101.1 chloramphenicol O-acetyltransferase type A [Pedobacter cryoconitis]
MQAVFNPVDQETWVRKPYFDYYYQTIKCKYNINANIDISLLLEETKKKGLKFYPTFLYVIMRAVNQNPEFRMSFDENGVLGTWNHVVPSYTIFHNDDKTFSDVWSEYKEEFSDFYQIIQDDIETYKDVKGIKARQGRPANFCPVSALPWLSFTGFNQDTYSESSLLFPIIRFGKYFTENGKTQIPVSVFVNHAIADGYHTCKLVNDIQDFADKVKNWI